ncbi:MAG: thiol:disulfide interchange protein DsbA/DsbL [Gammaproteobacteria bacterium]|jgi:protein dithiol oxidoreductase (disulfide-forming)
MKRLSSCASRLIGVLILVGVSVTAAQSEDIDVFGRYERIDAPVATESPGQVEVVELFWYGCPHCADFEPFVSRWQKNKPEYVNFRRTPAIFRESWEPHARVYYTAQILGVVDQIHLPLFEAMHTHKRKLMTREELMAFIAERGLDEAAFSRTYDSFAVDSLISRAKVMQARYGVMGVPAMVVNGKYRTSGSEAGSLENVIPVVEALVEREIRAMVSDDEPSTQTK